MTAQVISLSRDQYPDYWAQWLELCLLGPRLAFKSWDALVQSADPAPVARVVVPFRQTALKKPFVFEEVTLGQVTESARTMTDGDIRVFANLSGDNNPVHLDEAAGKASIFKSRVAHGMLSGIEFSRIFGVDFPGPGAVYLHQSLWFKQPVRIGDEVHFLVRVTRINKAKRQLRFRCEAKVGDKVVIEGNAIILCPEPPAQ